MESEGKSPVGVEGLSPFCAHIKGKCETRQPAIECGDAGGRGHFPAIKKSRAGLTGLDAVTARARAGARTGKKRNGGSTEARRNAPPAVRFFRAVRRASADPRRYA